MLSNNPAENRIFNEFFRDWNTTVTTSNKLYPKTEKKAVKKSRGRIIPLVVKYWEKFQKESYLESTIRKLPHSITYNSGKKCVRMRTTQCYRGTLKPFFDFMKKEFKTTFSEKEIRYLEYFFDFHSVREDVSKHSSFVDGVKSVLIDMVSTKLSYERHAYDDSQNELWSHFNQFFPIKDATLNSLDKVLGRIEEKWQWYSDNATGRTWDKESFYRVTVSKCIPYTLIFKLLTTIFPQRLALLLADILIEEEYEEITELKRRRIVEIPEEFKRLFS
ncbi:MAG: hypothetical protein HYW23_04190 [Candidatus Aenigmarchaeota archaeon]|nr:hypothetical protein [Candidatus Aenigmarchaeota archaeon]